MIKQLLLLSFLAQLAWGCHHDEEGEPTPVLPEVSLRESAEAAGKRVGAAVNLPELADDDNYAFVLASEFSALTPGNEMKWETTEPMPGTWNFEPADFIVEFAEDHGMSVKGHTLVWHNQLPDWVEQLQSPADLSAALQNHIETEVGYFQGRVTAWDVVNEAVSDDGGLRESVFLDKLGPGYIGDAFRWAHAADPTALLIYNDYGIEMPGPRFDTAYELLETLLAEGVPVHGVGLQMHVEAMDPPSRQEVEKIIEKFASLGLEVNISEMDVRIAKLSGSEAENLFAQRVVYHEIVSACMHVAACNPITFWGFTDRYSWIDNAFGEDDPLLFDEDFNAKPAFYGVQDALEGRELSLCGENLIANPGFEEGTAGWATWGGTLSASEERSHSGLFSGLTAERTEVYHGPVYNLRNLSQLGATYRISAWINLQEGAEDLAGGTVYIQDGSGERWIGIDAQTATGSGWTLLDGMFTASGTPPISAMALYFSGPTPGIDFYTDDVEMRPFCDKPVGTHQQVEGLESIQGFLSTRVPKIHVFP